MERESISQAWNEVVGEGFPVLFSLNQLLENFQLRFLKLTLYGPARASSLFI